MKPLQFTKCSLIGALAFSLFLISCEDKTVSISSKYKDHLISPDQMKILSSEYEKGNYAIINAQRKPETPDTRELYYDLEVLEGYIAHLKDDAKAKGITNPQVKIVFGQYPKDREIDKRQDPRYKGYQMIYLAPTENLSTKKAQAKSGEASFDDGSGLDLVALSPPN